MTNQPININDLLAAQRPAPSKKPPAYQWQDFALQIIDKLNVPSTKRNSVFRVCKQYPKPFVEHCLNDTLELVKDGEAWRYFFKLIEKGSNPSAPRPEKAAKKKSSSTGS
jgi:hypothetical protein